MGEQQAGGGTIDNGQSAAKKSLMKANPGRYSLCLIVISAHFIANRFCPVKEFSVGIVKHFPGFFVRDIYGLGLHLFVAVFKDRAMNE